LQKHNTYSIVKVGLGPLNYCMLCGEINHSSLQLVECHSSQWRFQRCSCIGLSSVLRPRQHSIGYMGDGFYRLKDPNQQYQSTEGTHRKQTNQTYNNQLFVQSALSYFKVQSAGIKQQHSVTEGLIEHSLTSPPTQYGLSGRRFLQVRRPNQQYQSTEGESCKGKQPPKNTNKTQNIHAMHTHKIAYK